MEINLRIWINLAFSIKKKNEKWKMKWKMKWTYDRSDPGPFGRVEDVSHSDLLQIKFVFGGTSENLWKKKRKKLIFIYFEYHHWYILGKLTNLYCHHWKFAEIFFRQWLR